MKTGLIDRDLAARQLRTRLALVVGVLVLAALALVARAVDLQLMDDGFLAGEAEIRHLREVKMPAHRGTVVDRFGEPLAVSTPVESVEVEPKVLLAQSSDNLRRLARALKRDPDALARRVSSNRHHPYVYVGRHLEWSEAARIRALQIPGVKLTREYRRYYPAGEVTGHVLGFTNVDDVGQEGLELAYDHYLTGQDGLKRIIQDGSGDLVEVIESVRAVQPGKDLVLSLDLRIQYLAYRELKAARLKHGAQSGSLVVLDIDSGEVLAMVNQPAFNPNDRTQFTVTRYRNRAATDIFEPGSSIKPFIIASALGSGKYRRASVIDASPIQVGVKLLQDKHPLGTIDLTTVLAKSSNVAMAKIALSLEPENLWTTLDTLGFGQVSASGYPGESGGLLSHHTHWRRIGIATLAYGYGLSVTPLQLAHAYATLGAGGVERPITFLRTYDPVPGERVMDQHVARELVSMLEAVITAEGTGARAALTGYRVSGKTGTAWKAAAGGYSTDKYMSVFAGVVPASRPRLAAVVVLDEPSGAQYYGGDVAAPVFANVMAGALRLMAVAPDDLPRATEATLAHADGAP